MDYLEIRELYHSQLRDNEMYHFGIKGQKWGIRRFQNEDGTLTEEGKERYAKPFIQNKINYNKVVSEMDKLIKQEPALKKDFGSAEQVNDPASFAIVAYYKYHLNSIDLMKAHDDAYAYYEKHKKEIRAYIKYLKSQGLVKQ